MATTTLSAAQLPSSWSQQRRDEYMGYFNDAAQRWGVPVQQLINQAYTESSLNPLKIGPTVNGVQAQGITQWMPGTRRDAINEWGFAPFNPMNPREAIDATAHFMSLIGTGYFQGYRGDQALPYDPLRASIGYIAGQNNPSLPQISSSAMDANFDWSQFGPQTLAYGERLSPGAYNVPLALRGATNLSPRPTDQQNQDEALASLAGRLPNLDYSTAAQFINPDGSFNTELLRLNPQAMPREMFAYFQAAGDLAGWGYDLQSNTARPGAGQAGWDLLRSIEGYVPGLTQGFQPDTFFYQESVPQTQGPGGGGTDAFIEGSRAAGYELPSGVAEFAMQVAPELAGGPQAFPEGNFPWFTPGYISEAEGAILQHHALMPNNLVFNPESQIWDVPQERRFPGATGIWGAQRVADWLPTSGSGFEHDYLTHLGYGAPPAGNLFAGNPYGNIGTFGMGNQGFGNIADMSTYNQPFDYTQWFGALGNGGATFDQRFAGDPITGTEFAPGPNGPEGGGADPRNGPSVPLPPTYPGGGYANDPGGGGYFGLGNTVPTPPGGYGSLYPAPMPAPTPQYYNSGLGPGGIAIAPGYNSTPIMTYGNISGIPTALGY